MTVRDAHPAEYAALGEICVAAYAAMGIGGTYADRLRDVPGRAETARVLVAEHGGRLLGCVTLILDGGPWGEIATSEEGEFRMLAVAPEAQGRGTGAALVRACAEATRARRRERLVLSTPSAAAAAHRLYERLGFRRTPARDWSPVAGIDLAVYELAL